MRDTNFKVRQALWYWKVPVWRLAKAFGKCENTMYRMLRNELPEDEQDRICQMIEEIAKGER